MNYNYQKTTCFLKCFLHIFSLSSTSFRYQLLRRVRVRSIPPKSNESSSWVNVTRAECSPSLGPLKRPRSSRFAEIHKPLPSQYKTFNRLRPLFQNRKRRPLKGSNPSGSRTNPNSPPNPLRISVDPTAT